MLVEENGGKDQRCLKTSLGLHDCGADRSCKSQRGLAGGVNGQDILAIYIIFFAGRVVFKAVMEQRPMCVILLCFYRPLLILFAMEDRRRHI